ncbi:MAG: hypothetical protein ABJA66_20750 [Actinomycetota bacterium]
MFSTFPGGIPGLGLLLLRITLGLTALVQGAIYLFERNNQALWAWCFALSAFAVGLSLLIGFLTPLSGFIVFLGSIFFIFLFHPATNLNLSAVIYPITISVAVITLGPGAFSLDARIFGRREIIIPERI